MQIIQPYGLKLYNCKTDRAPPSAIYIGRPTPFGNPFSDKPSKIQSTQYVDSRSSTIELYKAYLEQNTAIAKLARKQLRGKDLACWCSPLPCHGEILMAIANEKIGII